MPRFAVDGNRLFRSFLQVLLWACLAGTGPAQAADDRTTRAIPEEAGPHREGAKLVPQVSHAAGPSAASFSPDGGRVVTVGADRTAAVWDVEAGVLLHRLTGHTALVVSARFSPDGRRVVTASIDGSAIIWDPFTGAPLVTLRAKAGTLEMARFSPDGRRVVTTSRDNAAVWDATSGDLIYKLDSAHTGRVHDAWFSPDSGRLITVADDTKPVMWDLRTGKKVTRLDAHDDVITQAGFSPDGKRVFTSGKDGLTALWDPVFPQVLYRLQTPISPEDEERGLGAIRQASFSLNGDRLVTLREDGTVALWDLTTGKELARLTKIWSSVEFSPDGKQLVTAGNGTALWSAESGKLVLALSTNFSESASFSPDGQRVLAIVQIPGGTAADVFDRTSGERLRRLGGRVGSVSSASFAPSGNSILSSGSDHIAAIWDLASGEVARRLDGRDSFVQAAFSPDGALVVTADRAFGASAWDTATGQPLQPADKAGRPGRVVDQVQFSPDGLSLLTVGGGRAAVVDPRTNKVRADLEAGGAKGLSAGVYAPDGSAVYTTSAYQGYIAVWDPKTGKLKKKLQGFESGPMNRLAIAPDGKRLAANQAEAVVAVYDIEEKSVMLRLEHPGEVTSIAFSPDGSQLVTATRGGTATVWDAATGKSIRKLRGDCGTVFSAAYSPDGKRVLTACVDGSSRLWDVESGSEQLALLSFTDGTWAVVDKEGRFDASNDGDIDGLVWVIDDEAYALDQLRAQYYDPGLLSKVLGLRDEPLRQVPPLSGIRPPPLIHLSGPDENGRLEIKLEDRGGGVGDLFVTLNSSDITASINKKCPAVERGVACVVDLSKLPTWKKGANNQVEAFAEIESGTVRSRGTVREVTAGGQELTDPPDLWVLAIGVSDYSGTAIDLAYPSSDAARFADAMRIAGEDGFGANRVHVRVYGTGGMNAQGRPAKDTLDQAVAWMSAGDPGDTLVVFMAGHGVSWSVNGVDDYFYLLPDAGSADDLSNPSLRSLRAWSGKQIADALSKVPPLKRVVILDTCAAGKFETTSLSAERDLSSDAIRAHARAQERTGAWFLAGAAADKVSYEASRYSQGILTYSLLEGMKGPAVGADDLLLVSDLFEYAEEKVPEYAQGIGGIQKPVIRRGDADDFVIGELPPAERNRIQLQKVRPVVVRASVVAEGGRPDSLGLESAINRALRDRSAGDAAPIVFWDSDGTSDTWQISGQYTNVDGTVKFTGFLSRTVAGTVTELPLQASGPSVIDVAKLVVVQVVDKAS